MKRIGILLVLAVMLTGCGRHAEIPCRVITGVDVQYQQGGAWVERTYFQQESMEAVLNYLRMLKPEGIVLPDDPQTINCQITVHFSDGTDKLFFQQGNIYLREGDGAWEKIDRQQAQLLYPLLLLMPSDS